MEKKLEKATTFVTIAITKKESALIADLILLELEKLALMENELLAHGIPSPCDLKCRRIDLKYLLKTFSEKSE